KVAGTGTGTFAVISVPGKTGHSVFQELQFANSATTLVLVVTSTLNFASIVKVSFFPAITGSGESTTLSKTVSGGALEHGPK
ncbi:17855_t:CDS:2, partial [Rhizophagus irregularis]